MQGRRRLTDDGGKLGHVHIDSRQRRSHVAWPGYYARQGAREGARQRTVRAAGRAGKTLKLRGLMLGLAGPEAQHS